MWKKFIYIAIVLLLAGFHLNCDNFLSGGILDSDPNRTTEVPLLEQLANLQSVLYGFYEGDIGIFAYLQPAFVCHLGHTILLKEFSRHIGHFGYGHHECHQVFFPNQLQHFGMRTCPARVAIGGIVRSVPVLGKGSI